MLTNQFMFTVLDDETIRAATVTADGRLVAGLGSYRVVILAYTQYISVDALEKLTVFVQASGTVILIGDTPAHGLRLDQEEAIAALMAKLEGQPTMAGFSEATLIPLLEEKAHRDLTVSVVSGDKANLFMGDFESADRDVTFLVNAGYNDTVVKLAYTDGYAGQAVWYHPENGYIETVTLGDGLEITVPASVGLILMREADNTRDDTPFVSDEASDGTAEDTTASDTDGTDAPDTGDVADTTAVETGKKGCGAALSIGVPGLVSVFAWICWKKKEH